MTAIWGPLGWMTLHSTAFAYPESPTSSERELMTTWLDMFRDTITCPSCKGHFTDMLASYRMQFPNMLQNRHEFVMFTFRAHNAVNRRLNKPVYSSVEECVTTLRNNVKNRSAKDYRISYINHITRHWRTYQDVTGIVALKKIQEMRRIEEEYVLSRDTNFTIVIRPDIVVLPQSIMDRRAEQQASRPMFFGGPTSGATAGFQITSRGLRLRR
jgi:hypothetical protein